MLTYGGHPVSMELMARAQRRGIAVVFHLHDFAYDNRSAFRFTDAVIVPTEYCRRHYARKLGLEATLIPYPFHAARVVADDRQPKYLTFVNPVPEKGVTVFGGLPPSWAGGGPTSPCWLWRPAAPRIGWDGSVWISPESRAWTGWPTRRARATSTG